MTEDRARGGVDPFAAAGALLGYAIAGVTIALLVYAAFVR